MSYGYAGRGYSYDSPSPKELDSASIEELIEILHTSIDSGKLKDMKGALSKLKLAINHSIPLYTQNTVPFTAYVYAVKSGNKKSIDSLKKAIVKKNYEFDGLPTFTLLTNMDKSDFKIILNDFLLDSSFKYFIEGPNTLREMFDMFPNELEQIIINGKISKFTKGDDRIGVAQVILSKAKKFDTIIITLVTLFGIDYIDKFGISEIKLTSLRNALFEQPNSMVKRVLKEWFYVIYVDNIPIPMFVSDINSGLLDDDTVKNYSKLQFRKNMSGLVEVLGQIDDIQIRATMVMASDEITSFILENKPELIPSDIQEMFLF